MRRFEASRTAEMVCLCRATDQRRPPEQRILDDPYARAFLTPLSRAGLATLFATGRLGQWAEELSLGLVTYILCRHRFIDDALRSALARGVEQVVILGAGYDTRAFRFSEALGSRPVFELDFPSTARRKARILEAEPQRFAGAPGRRAVQTDLSQEPLADALARADCPAGRRTFFIWEGVSMYLPRAAVKGTLTAIAAHAGPGSALAMDFWYLLDAPNLVAAAHRTSPNLLQVLGEPIVFGIHPEDVGAFMQRHGFEVQDLATADELRRRYVRDDRSVYPACYALCARLSPA